ncbi:MAG: hypothetical protein FWE05_01015 [Defluviitaleaceae bacterium]|nr:hypothetical protein [Defluviitaleaceae bacterium]
MGYYKYRMRNRLRQTFYKPLRPRSQNKVLASKVLAAFDEIDKNIEEKITPLLSGLFRD